MFAGGAGDFKKRKNFSKLLDVKEELLQDKTIGSIEGAFDAIEVVHDVFKEEGVGKWPVNDQQLAQEILLLELSRGEGQEDFLAPYLSFDYSHARLQVTTPKLSSQDLDRLISSVKEKTGEEKVSFSGPHMLFFTLNKIILDTQAVSLGLTLLAIAFLLGITIGLKEGALTMLVNLFPLGVASLLATFFQIPLDFATILIASIGLGVCVDDGVHFIHYYHELQKQGMAHQRALRESMRMLIRPLGLTSFLFTLVFLSFLGKTF